MVKEFDGMPVSPSWPDGIAVRSATGEEDKQRAILCAYEAFQDHWGFSPEPLEN